MYVVDLEKMKRLRKEKMSLEKMASLIGYKTINGYYYLETGRSEITANKLAQVAEVLGVEIMDLYKKV
ncbi:transcriptional regulator with XRE-family HTH domain [Pullulanibacillus pueri]|uniref:HTH cro/C1-type domain-containing protein n=1 Tax=Pullulanibacillus pueri TaxID=1437324 RepID=A0A8J2ZX20_9BACL|nr:helix-turn-helix transcriptional regulator [Pullulanibacillus pueri]MBM7681925.1 transcriptional regulator with XRE-family HTH domain [Pullulanibacillus pueri]GGH83468.1 hypothetical protein GCM10007096_24380 [Pullulanibacillus pueri]